VLGGEVGLQVNPRLRLWPLLCAGAGFEALQDTTCLTGQADEGVVVDGLAVDHSGLQTFTLNRQPGRRLDLDEIMLGELGKPSQWRRVDLAKIGEAPRVSATPIGSTIPAGTASTGLTREESGAIGNRRAPLGWIGS
jgi:hypothetical protein